MASLSTNNHLTVLQASEEQYKIALSEAKCP